MDTNLICPVDGKQINESKVRVVAGLVLVTALIYLITNWLFLPVLLLIDFALRSADAGKYSPLGNVADGILSVITLPNKPTDQAPKRFAARIGLGFSVLIIGLHLLGISTVIPVATLAVFAALESLAGFCAGCYVYTYYIRLVKTA
ncbi:DUF4395 domain-containing protein [Spirosoma terrae]|uniref:DUF4395 domain-containing protein n=1 Tax=Spirosoma terrae TaxID=1968276 RepID=A0A6L9LD09_9BACT|nr:DUF4395 domain-containing protein [Spirosoma terrae]NDU97262.1 DUF4395 domain-containing protein [Spirosoma terrae]